MILNGNERSGAARLARHLMNAQDNEHVELHELRGFVADDLHGALLESEAIAKGTRCEKHLFSLSLNPPQDADVPIEAFEAAIEKIEKQLGLENQPRAIVFHEKEGRRHAHAVWSKIDGEKMKAVNLSFYKRDLTRLSKELFLEHGWSLPNGLKDHRLRDPLNFTLEEWQQGKRTGLGAKQTKALIRDCWNSSDTQQSFEAALREKGFWLAQGDRRGFVAVDWRGEVYSLSRSAGVKTKELTARLGKPSELLSIDEVRAQIGAQLTPKLVSWVKEEAKKARRTNLAAEFQREQIVQRHRKTRAELKKSHNERWLTEELARASRTPRGIRGLWGWITGKNRKARKINEAEIAQAKSRDRRERHVLILAQLKERRSFQRQIKLARSKQRETLAALGHDIAIAMKLGRVPEKTKHKNKARPRDRNRRDDGPDFEPH
ncbi:MAG: relaxase/mobilization nuclease domain-containing protein [Pseudomonadota bacterium]